jgi:hypothetical protein
MTSPRREAIGDAELWLGNAFDIIPTLPKVDAVIVDPPYSERTHAGHDAAGAGRKKLGYAFLSDVDVARLSLMYAGRCSGWVVWLTDHTLAPVIAKCLADYGRYVFAPLPYFHPGRSVRLTGDGPNSWTDWIVAARTAAQFKWGTLPGGYVAGPGWNDKARMGGKPTALMDALVADYSRPGDTVLDSHMGAGTTGVACVRAGRAFIGIEVDPEAFDLSCRRIEQAYKQRPLFEAEPPKAPEQLGLEAA